MPAKHRFLVVTQALLIGSLASCQLASASPATADGFNFKNPETAEQLFPAGAYIYYDASGAAWDSVTMRSHFRYLSGIGLNTINVTSLIFPDRSDITILDMAKDYNIHVIYQFDTSTTLTGVVNGVKASIDSPNLLAYSVKEEPAVGEIPGLFAYYKNIQDSYGTPNVPFFLLHDKKESIKYVFDTYKTDFNFLPEITGSDRYFFRWQFESDIGYIDTPKMAFTLLMDNTETSLGIPPFVANTAPGQKYYSVFTSNAWRSVATLNDLKNMAFGHPLNNKDAQDCSQTPVSVTNCLRYNRWIALAKDGNQGLNYVSDAVGVKYWSYYRPPQGAMGAQAWLSVAAGAQGIMAWSADPGNTVSPDLAGMFDAQGQPHRSLGEFAQAARDLKPFGKIINQMQRDSSSDGLVTISTPADSSLASELYARAYSIAGVSGHIFVLANTHIGTWTGNSTIWLASTESYHIDERGEVVSKDFTPADLLNVNLAAGASIFDLQNFDPQSTLTAITNININPGSGRLIYVGTQADFKTLRSLAGISTTFPVAGRALLNADDRANVEQRLVAPLSPLSSSSGYDFYSHDIELNRLYKLDMTVSTSSGGAFGAVAIGYDVNWNAIQTLQINVWNQTAATPTIFSSNEFKITNADPKVVHARVAFYRSNQQGGVKVLDAWLQSLKDETRLTGTFGLTITKRLTDPTKTYQVAVNARALPGEKTSFGVKWYSCTNNGCDGGHNLITPPSGSTQQLSLDNRLFQTATFKSTDSKAVYIKLVIYKTNTTTANTLVLERASAWAVN